MFANQSESHAMTEDDLEDYEVETDEAALELYGGGEEPEGDDELPVAAYEDGEDAPESSLDELLARRAAKAALEGEEEGGLGDLVSLLDDAPGGLQVRTVTTNRPEFICTRCRLVKPRVQLSDTTRSLCRDCA